MALRKKAEFTFQVRCNDTSEVTELRHTPQKVEGNVNKMNTLVWFHNPANVAAIEFTGTVAACGDCNANNYKVRVELWSIDGKKCKVTKEKFITVPNVSSSQHSLYATCMRNDITTSQRFGPEDILEVRFLGDYAYAKEGKSGKFWNQDMFNGANGIQVTLPGPRSFDDPEQALMPMWLNNDQGTGGPTVSYYGRYLNYEAMPDFYKAHHEATVLGMSVVLDSVPIAFCWKEGGDFGKTPDCKSGWTKQGQMCYKNCTKSSSRGWKLVAGTCWEKCKSGYHDHGATCYKKGGFFASFLDFYFKRSYVTTQKTMFQPEAVCPPKHYKEAALCYEDCRDLNNFSDLVNCGIGACAYSTKACFTEVAEMTIEVAEGVFQFTSFVGGLGGLNTASKFFKVATSPMAKASSFYMNEAASVFGKLKDKFLRDDWVREFEGNVRRRVEELLDDVYLDVLGEEGLEEVIHRVVAEFQRQFRENEEMKRSWDVTGLGSVTGLNEVFAKCVLADDNTDVNNNIACVDAAMEMLYWIDYTGLTSLASAFLKPLCKF